MKKNCFGFGFFTSDIIGGVGFWSFCLMLLGLGPNCYSRRWDLG